MADEEPVAELPTQFSSAGATVTPWAEALGHLEAAEASRSARPAGGSR